MSRRRMLTEAEVAERLKCTRAAVRLLRQGGDLPFMAGRRVLIDEADLEAMLASQERRKLNPYSDHPLDVAASLRAAARASARARRIHRLRRCTAEIRAARGSGAGNDDPSNKRG